ncbi:hypothetical protein Taro_005907 [Colocasia esculenta]|uniref:DUF4378 domain-containing protein n=1 Tax=Colocasia esculenta TaxID=4460 RepID=A0A843TZ83_COLES|nr:hypothetical protein [Colocasia esculenta]
MIRRRGGEEGPEGPAVSTDRPKKVGEPRDGHYSLRPPPNTQPNTSFRPLSGGSDRRGLATPAEIAGAARSRRGGVGGSLGGWESSWWSRKKGIDVAFGFGRRRAAYRGIRLPAQSSETDQWEAVGRQLSGNGWNEGPSSIYVRTICPVRLVSILSPARMALCAAKTKKGKEGRTSDVFVLLFSKISGAEMNEFQHRKGARHLQKPIPGCMGRIVNVLDLNAGMAGRKMLTDRANRDGSPVWRNQPGIPKKMVNPVAPRADEKRVTYEPKTFSSKKGSSGTSMKMLIAQEMSKGAETRQKPPSVIAKLMGLDALPAQQPGPTIERTSHEFYKHNVHGQHICPSDFSASTHNYGEQELGYLDKSTQQDVHPSQYYHHEQEYKDVFEIRPQPSRSNHRDQHTSQNHNEDTNGNRMALVRQKFMEAKRLATDQKLLQTKEFQDALEVLNSNRDLFLKFLEEPTCLFSKHLQELRACPTSPQTKCITVLKPSNAVRYKSGTEMRKQQTLEDVQVHRNSISWSPGSVHHLKSDHLSQPTRIVVLKPSPRKLQDLKSLMSSPTLCRGLIKGRDHFEESGTEMTRGSKEAAKDITLKMRESYGGSPMDETLFSSILSHGYVGDESSLNRSENEFLEVDDGNFSDSEVVTPTSRHSWDYVYRLGSPYSLSSLSQTSYSPESSVIREAKKRLSERWAMVASHGTGQEQRLIHKSSSTLGEMLAISELNKGGGNNMLSSSSCSGEQDVKFPAACSLSTKNKDESGGLGTPKSLPRSKSVPVSSLAYDNIELNVKDSDSQIDKSTASKDLKRSNSGKLSLKGKVSSLFFSKNKRPGREKIASSSLVDTPDIVQSTHLDCIGKRNGVLPLHTPDSVGGPSQVSGEVACEISSLSPLSEGRAEEVTSSTKAASAPENSNENQEQPSPISVLEAHFEDDLNSSSSRSSEELISRSPLIESVTRSLAWDGGTRATPLKLSKVLHEKDEDEERYSFVKALLLSAGFGDEKSSSVLARWHSPDSPLDPLLLDKFLEHKDEEAKCRKRVSNQRLLFDCVNAVLLDISWTNLWDSSQAKFRKSSMSHNVMLGDVSITEEVWSRIKEWFQGEVNQGKNVSLVVDRVLRKEVAERGWAELTSLETDEIGKELQGNLLEELVEEALADLIPMWS